MSSITVVDYGAGNLLSVVRALDNIGAQVILASQPDEIAAAERLVLPGVGAFGACMGNLCAKNLQDAIAGFTASGRPLLGICVGMQMLFDASEEFGENKGLGLLPGRVCAIPQHGADGRQHKIPHIGWNALIAESDWHNGLFRDVHSGESVYFVHSFAANPTNPGDVSATVDYDGIKITAAVGRDNIWGCQFHPEKSGIVGLKLLRNFMAL